MEEKTIDINEIVKIEQMPIVFEQLEKIGKYIDKNLKGIDKLECTEENKQEVKNRRTAINNTLKLLEDKRKEIKNKLLEPYDIFEQKYNNECKEKLQDASNKLKDKIDTIEIQQKKDKENELREFFEQHKETYHLNFLNFEDIGLNITLSASMTSLKEQIKDFCEKLDKDIKLIEIDDNKDKMMLEYLRNGYDYQKAKLTLIEEQKKLEELKQQMEQKQEIEKQEEVVIEKVQEVIAPVEIIEDEEVLESTFTVRATKDKLKLLIEFMNNNGIEVIE